jgi:hypothetical protein
MSIALLAVPGVLAPLQGFLRWLVPGLAQAQLAHPVPHIGQTDTTINPIAPCVRLARADFSNHAKVTARRPLRIVRVMEAGQTPSQVGRMVISGRMADVCAELDRLAAREAALH